MSDISTRDRYRGCLLGLAAGDALGTTLEFQRAGSFDPIDDMVGGGPFGLAPGQWTDDTSMALCLAASLIESPGFDAADQMDRYLRWMREGYMSSTGTCFDIGNTVRAALLRFERTSETYSGPTDPWFAGDGSLMGLAPVPMFFARNLETAIRMSEESSRPTHETPVCVDACRCFGGLIVRALQGEPKEVLPSTRYSPVDGLWFRQSISTNLARCILYPLQEQGSGGARSAESSLLPEPDRPAFLTVGSGHQIPG